MRRRFFNDYLLREIALSQHATGFPVHVCMFAAEVRSTKSPNSAREPALTCHLPASSLPGALLPSGTAAASGAGRGMCAGLLANEVAQGMRPMNPWRVGQQRDRNMTVCARVGRFGAENGPFHVRWRVLCGQ